MYWYETQKERRKNEERAEDYYKIHDSNLPIKNRSLWTKLSIKFNSFTSFTIILVEQFIHTQHE